MSDIESVLAKLLADEKIQEALKFLEDDEAATFEELKEMVKVPGETFHEQEGRTPMYKAKLEKYGVDSIEVDEIGSVLGYVDGAEPRPKIMLDAHLDTVFAMAEPLEIKELGDDRYNCPGMSDDTACLAMDLTVLRAIRHAGLIPQGRIMITGTVRHEGEGDLGGMKTLFARDKTIDACFCSETLTKPGAIINTAIGVHRYELIFRGPGGHSWLDFGRPNPIQALCRAGAMLSELQPPTDPKTSFNLGTVTGGTTVNAIPAECRAKLDIRSVLAPVLNDLDARIHKLVDEAVAAENARWQGEPITVEWRQIGDRPAGVAPAESLVVKLLWKATEAVGLEPNYWPPLGTNANVPISMGIPSTGFGGAGIGGNLHSRAEWYSPKHSAKHAQRILLTIFAMAGLKGVTEPLAPIRKD
ncbi:MAG: M20/M25/M40 family metallo-hydrolase [Methylobacteriaceae bacterium]|jgi:acetylornithine deacetylase/succinyl-diaminopimelate desuccinylase-like protein|nr:M20/M25/M40 family metallo-hydrolase [Methylobacteriaceae bacterium]